MSEEPDVGGFRGSDETLDAEIETLEAIARLRLRRYAKDLKDVESDLHALKVERTKRRARASVPESDPTEEYVGETSQY